VRGDAGRPCGARGRGSRQKGRLIATQPVLLWTDAPAPYVGAANSAGLGRVFEFVTAPLTSDPGDDHLARCEALLAWRAPARLSARAPRLRWIHSLTGGAEQWLASPDLPADVLLTCARGSHRVQMPENILGALFFLTKQLGAIALDQREHRWTRRINETLAGKTLGILGLGAIGTEVARKAAALEMRVIGTRREQRAVPMVDRVWGPDGTGEVLSRSDFVLLLLPSTAQTRGLVDARLLSLMKPSAFLLNFARGDLIVDEDLVEAVRTRRIAGAVLDVFRTEPLPADSPLWTTAGITIFPHVGGLHPQRDALVAELWVENLRRLAEDRPLHALADRARGY